MWKKFGISELMNNPIRKVSGDMNKFIIALWLIIILASLVAWLASSTSKLADAVIENRERIIALEMGK
jgi:archaellum component FlaG (FlaF/FlaG flagellin family)